MKKVFVFIGIVLVILLIISSKYSTTSQSIENLAYVIAIGIDNGDNGLLKVTLQIATPSSNSSGSGSSEQSSESTTTTVECSTINSGLNLVNSYINLIAKL